MRNRRELKLVLLLVIVCSATLPMSARSARKVSLHDLDGKKTRVSDLSGNIVVLNFWATWCGPCKEELPRLSQLSQQYASKKVVFVLASIDETKKVDTVRDYVAAHSITLPVWIGGSTELLEQISGTNIVPATAILDDNGTVIRAINGEAREEDVKEAVDWLLSGRQGTAPADRVKRY
jgi:thiol-disulfide isomerase/thioredoxin